MKNLLIFITLVIAVSCNRKLHTEKTETHEVTDKSSTVDSLNRIIKTWANAYEELLKTTNSTGVVFESIPCDTVKTGKQNVPNKITVSPDGTKTFEGNIKSYKDDKTLESKISAARQWAIDSMSRLVKKDTTHHEQSAVVVVRTVKSSFIPLWMWIVLGIVGLLWLNERLSLFKIPFITRTSLFTKK